MDIFMSTLQSAESPINGGHLLPPWGWRLFQVPVAEEVSQAVLQEGKFRRRGICHRDRRDVRRSVRTFWSRLSKSAAIRLWGNVECRFDIQEAAKQLEYCRFDAGGCGCFVSQVANSQTFQPW